MHQITETQLFDAPLTLKQRMLYDVEYQLIVDVDKAIHGVIYYFEFVGGHSIIVLGKYKKFCGNIGGLSVIFLFQEKNH
jgi:hypothetical protein